MRRRKEYDDTIEGKQFGNLIVIGDTGKLTTDKRRLFIARHIETGKIIETTYTNLKNGVTNGFNNNINYKEEITKRVIDGRNSLSKKEERQRTLKTIISNMKNRKGYYFDKRKKKYIVRIQFKGKTKHIGCFETEQEAKAARQKAVDEQIKILEKQLEEL
ncbi:hypothetical protein RJC11_03340 [Staphylococcus hominis]|uniref:hypothetical protein n=1 Tax=Staphylococcus hominis TaxID=1290 RepID=UPI00287A6BD1|nr:hypothetical protein [Staphylococcus hominis]MDS3910727.1 hypothetical protein [Staphylococcus hominis]